MPSETVKLTRVEKVPGLWKIEAGTNGYLFVCGERSLMIDCPSEAVAAEMKQAGLPAPSAILHTQVQEEHCREWAAFPDAKVYAFAGSADVARRSPGLRGLQDRLAPFARLGGTRRGEIRHRRLRDGNGPHNSRSPSSPNCERATSSTGRISTWKWSSCPAAANGRSGFTCEASGSSSPAISSAPAGSS